MMAMTDAMGTASKLPPLLPRLVNKLTTPRSAPAQVLRLHRWIYRTSDGRIGPGMIGAWTLLLHTVGRRTGQRRTSALVFARDGERIILAASNDGKDHPPAWFLNLCANPEVELQIGRQHLAGTATVVGSGDPSYPQLWELMNRTNHRRYDAYQAKTTRPIPLIAVAPAP
jgi:deazaflavin-dependent oxidoreductase (nitroreductase family)